MNDRQENRLGSYRTTGQVLTDNAALFTTLPALGLQHTKLLDSVSLIDSLAMLQSTNTTGITAAKGEILRQMMDSTLLVAGAVRAYASENENLDLKARVKVTESSFHSLRDDQRDDLAQGIHDAANDNLAGLADYGITAATLSGLQTRIEAYRLAIPGPSAARANRRSKTELLDEEVRRAGMICKERLDGLMEPFKSTQPDFYNAYHAARDIIDTGHRKKTPPPTP